MNESKEQAVAVFSTKLGHAAVRIQGGRIVQLVLADDAASARRALGGDAVAGAHDHAPVARLRAALSSGEPVALPLAPRGTPFQRRVWAALAAIPPGQTRSYGEIARSLGLPTAARAVGTACGANPIAVLVPCHRAVRADGGLGGYRWGLARKQRLLAREGASATPTARATPSSG